jgi:hypothetical protein
VNILWSCKVNSKIFPLLPVCNPWSRVSLFFHPAPSISHSIFCDISLLLSSYISHTCPEFTLTATEQYKYSLLKLQLCKGRAIAQAVSRWLPTAVAQIRAWVWSCGICGGQSGTGAGFVWVLRFPLPIFIPPIAPQSSSSIIWGLYNRPEVAAVPRDLVPPHQ